MDDNLQALQRSLLSKNQELHEKKIKLQELLSSSHNNTEYGIRNAISRSENSVKLLQKELKKNKKIAKKYRHKYEKETVISHRMTSFSVWKALKVVMKILVMRSMILNFINVVKFFAKKREGDGTEHSANILHLFARLEHDYHTLHGDQIISSLKSLHPKLPIIYGDFARNVFALSLITIEQRSPGILGKAFFGLVEDIVHRLKGTDVVDSNSVIQMLKRIATERAASKEIFTLLSVLDTMDKLDGKNPLAFMPVISLLGGGDSPQKNIIQDMVSRDGGSALASLLGSYSAFNRGPGEDKNMISTNSGTEPQENTAESVIYNLLRGSGQQSGQAIPDLIQSMAELLGSEATNKK